MPVTNASTPATAPHEDAPLRVAVILGSVREGRQGPAVADWFLGAAHALGGLDLDLIDLADVDLPLVMPGWGGSRTRGRPPPSRRSARGWPPPRPSSSSPPSTTTASRPY